MQKIRLITIIFIAGSLFMTSCSKDDNSIDTSDKVNEISSFAQSGTWKVTYFNDSGTDETYHFTGYNFTFGSGGTVTAVNGSATQTGTWSVTSGSSSSSSNKFNLNFSDVEPFDELNDDWDILEYTSAIIKLKDISGGNGGIDYLTYEKN
jgi:hypothetical protein